MCMALTLDSFVVAWLLFGLLAVGLAMFFLFVFLSPVVTSSQDEKNGVSVDAPSEASLVAIQDPGLGRKKPLKRAGRLHIPSEGQAIRKRTFDNTP